MGNKRNIKELITAYLDNEIKSQEELSNFKTEIEKDPTLDFDLKTESLTKRLVNRKGIVKGTPDRIKKDILEKLSKERVIPAKKSSLASRIYSQRFIAYSTAGIILLALVLLLINRPDLTSNNISEQTGKNNMIVLAQSYFADFLNGNNKIQFTSDNPEDIKNFFQSQGVKYVTIIPTYNNYSLAGASVYEHHGEIFAHHIYTAKNGKFIYVFQVHEDYFKGDSIIHLTEDLLNYLRNGNKYVSRQNNFVTVLKKQNDNVLALITNCADEELPDSFLAHK
jgi:hypothetical protein